MPLAGSVGASKAPTRGTHRDDEQLAGDRHLAIDEREREEKIDEHPCELARPAR